MGKTDKMKFKKIKNICSLKVISKKSKRYTTYWGEIFTTYISINIFVSKTYREHIKFNNKINNSIKK